MCKYIRTWFTLIHPVEIHLCWVQDSRSGRVHFKDSSGLSHLSGKWKLWSWWLNKIVRVSLPTESYQRFAGICHHWGRMSWVPRSRNCTSCVPSSPLHVYQTQTRPQGPHSPGSETAAQRGTPHNTTHTHTHTPHTHTHTTHTHTPHTQIQRHHPTSTLFYSRWHGRKTTGEGTRSLTPVTDD